MRALVTGGSGFAGRWLVSRCSEAGDSVVAVSRTGEPSCDLRDAGAVRRAVAAAEPDVVYHLAAQAHVGRSWEDPGATLQDNIVMTLNVLEAVRAEAPSAVVIAVASGEVYGPPERLPVDESAPLHPQNPYAVSKASADLLARMYADAHGLNVIRVRAFNHSGPGQEPVYAIASFARQVAAGLEAGESPVRVVTGNPNTRRDYTDVRDVVRAYRALAAAGAQVRGEAFNVCSGRTASAGELVAALGEAAGVEIDHAVDQSLVRAHEVMEVRGAHDKLTAATGWHPSIPLEETLRDSVDWWRGQLRSS